MYDKRFDREVFQGAAAKPVVLHDPGDTWGHGFMGLTVLRSPIYAHHAPEPLDFDKEYSFMDQGLQRFMYAIVPHDGTWREAGIVKRAAELNQRPVTNLETFHDGPLPQSGSFIDVAPEAVVVSALKQAEDGGALIVRAYETTGARTDRAVITLPHLDRTIEASFGPYEIKTFRVPYDAKLPISETNLIEWDNK